ncbi:MAG: helix-turn-helix domain-containing protein [Eubacteriales bacterium]|nr:helix-turn-helix domain-containing protein [Eubacteriales bacterium]
MDGQQGLFDMQTIRAAVAGERWATEKVIAHYADYINELATVEVRQPDGSIKKVLDEDMKQQITLKLLEELPNFPLEQA